MPCLPLLVRVPVLLLFLLPPSVFQALSMSAVSSSTLRKPPHFLLLTSDTGGGHRASAMSLLSALNSTSPYSELVESKQWDYSDPSKVGYARGFTYELLDMWTAAGAWPYRTLVDSYTHLSRAPNQWR